jgi:hypothetical protein
VLKKTAPISNYNLNFKAVTAAFGTCDAECRDEQWPVENAVIWSTRALTPTTSRYNSGQMSTSTSPNACQLH